MKESSKHAKDKGDWAGFRLSLGKAIQGSPISNKFLKANQAEQPSSEPDLRGVRSFSD